MNDPARLWADPRLVYAVAAISVVLLLVAVWLFGRRRRQGRQAGIICLILSIAFHVALIFLVPLLPDPPGGSSSVDEWSKENPGVDSLAFSTFDPEMLPADAAAESQFAMVPLPVANLSGLLALEATSEPPLVEPEPKQNEEPVPVVPEALSESSSDLEPELMPQIASELDRLLEEAFSAETSSDDEPPSDAPPPTPVVAAEDRDRSDPPNREQIAETTSDPATVSPTPSSRAESAPGTVIGAQQNDFANRSGSAKELALMQTGGSPETEAAVDAALRFLVSLQRPDGAWDPRATGAGVERSPLGTSRGGAGSRAETAITGLALLSLMGAGHTHQRGEFSDNVYRGLVYLIRSQKPDGSLIGNASVYEATYCHGMAALAICEAAAITRDPSAMVSAQRAIDYTVRIQHPSTGGWRYTDGDPGDLSQLGWQAMVLDAGQRAGIRLDPRSVAGVQRFLQSVRMGSRGGMACYRRGEAPSRTMTAEALATRLLFGERVPPIEIEEAERYLLQQPPGVGQDNYYYWYYATLALHQLQDQAWQQWNEALQQRLLGTQRSDGSWPSDTVWGGYGGTVYTTSMATLCLETYYRHAIRTEGSRMARQPDRPSER